MSAITALLNLTGSFTFVIGLCILGIAICIYAIKVETVVLGEKKKHGKPSYSQLCDVNESVSCTLVLTSKYSHMTKLIFNLDEKSFFNRSNAEYGLLFYVALLIFHFYPFTLFPFHAWFVLLGAIGSVLASCGLAYILKYILHNLCLICVCMYVVNTLLLISSIMRLVNA